jgi:hypothetical protein
MLEFLKISGAVLGIVAFFWKVIDTYKSYLHISINIKEVNQSYALIKLQVDNRYLKPKTIDNAILLIGPEPELPVETYNKIAGEVNLGKTVKNTNEIAEHCLSSPIYIKNRAIIPLPFFYSENLRIADENPTYTVSIDLHHFEKNKTYSVRFFILGENRLHRTSQDCFLLIDS